VSSGAEFQKILKPRPASHYTLCLTASCRVHAVPGRRGRRRHVRAHPAPQSSISLPCFVYCSRMAREPLWSNDAPKRGPEAGLPPGGREHPQIWGSDRLMCHCRAQSRSKSWEANQISCSSPGTRVQSADGALIDALIVRMWSNASVTRSCVWM
jgi:hypothetical protein